MIQLPSSKLQQARSHNEDWGNWGSPRPTSRGIHSLSPSFFLYSSSSPQKRERHERKRDDCFSLVTLLTVVLLLLSVRLITTWHISGFFSAFGLHVNYSGEQIIYVSHPFLTAHFNDYSVFLSFLNYSPTTPPPSLFLTVGKENAFCLLIALKTGGKKRRKKVNCPIAWRRKKSMHINAFLTYARLHDIKTFCHIAL